MRVVVCGCTHALAHMWRSENTFQGSVLSFCYGGSRDQVQIIKPGSKHLCLLTHLASPPLSLVPNSSHWLSNSVSSCLVKIMFLFYDLFFFFLEFFF